MNLRGYASLVEQLPLKYGRFLISYGRFLSCIFHLHFNIFQIYLRSTTYVAVLYFFDIASS